MKLRVQDDRLLKVFGNNMRVYMDAEGMSFSDLSNVTGISRNALMGYAAGRYAPTLCAIVVIAQALDADINELIGVE